MRTVVIVGTGVAGATAAQTLRKEGFDGRVILIGDEPHDPYRRPPLSKDLLAGKVDALKIRLEAPQYWADHQIELLTGTTVTALDPRACRLTLGDGSDLAYDTVLLATGGRPRTLAGSGGAGSTGAGSTGAGVYTLRQLDDVEPLRRAIQQGQSLLVVGAGLIGCEVAATARAMGSNVTMIDFAPNPLDRLVPGPIGQYVADLHRSKGVRLHTGVALDRIDAVGAGISAVARDGASWQADAAIVAIGMVPNTELAVAAGLRVQDGIVVDERFATSAAGVFAAGDVALSPNPILGGRQRAEHWNSARDQGAAAARAMLGIGDLDGKVASEVPWCWSTQYGLNLQVAGWPGREDELIVRGDIAADSFTILCRRGGRLVGAIAVGRPKDIRAARQLIRDLPDVDPAILADATLALADIPLADIPLADIPLADTALADTTGVGPGGGGGVQLVDATAP